MSSSVCISQLLFAATKGVGPGAHLLEVYIVGGNPAHPAEHAQGREDVLGKPEIDKHGGEGNTEEFKLRYLEDFAPGTLDRRISIGVESSVEGYGNQARWPYTV